MILADNSGNKALWSLSAVQDSRFDFDYSTFAGIHGSDFEAVDESSLMIDEDSGKARITPVVTPTPTPTPTKTPTPPSIPAPSGQSDNGMAGLAIAVVSIGIAAICCVVGFLEK